MPREKNPPRGSKRAHSRSSSRLLSPRPSKKPRRQSIPWPIETTLKLISILVEKPNLLEKLFSSANSSQANTTGKTNTQIWNELAQFIFKDVEELQDRLKNDLNGVGASVRGHVDLLKSKYQRFHKKLGATGAGLLYEDLREGSTAKNLVDEFTKNNEWYPFVHGWWRTHPTYNPIAHDNSRSSSGDKQAGSFQRSTRSRGRKQEDPPPESEEEEVDQQSESEASSDSDLGSDEEATEPPVTTPHSTTRHKSRGRSTASIASKSSTPSRTFSPTPSKRAKSSKHTPTNALDCLQDAMGDASSLTATSQKLKELSKARQHEIRIKELGIKESTVKLKTIEAEERLLRLKGEAMARSQLGFRQDGPSLQFAAWPGVPGASMPHPTTLPSSSFTLMPDMFGGHDGQ
ncbi:hypothetical protein DL93DRAFT_2234292 [Clavulina sp. PMI_390]|nr:hypothetical protein DL93DRAFT_2234292 [Clavulina sp. PMI_390]